ncbi:MAG: hypothetical protein IT366_05825 [Candidatus Hydrogenedentes bacterium]|nr:hypothetical protein [Candidatus Hydrogenedentota bacterium]
MNNEISLKTKSKTLLLTAAFLLAAKVYGESTAFDFSTLQPRDRIWMSRTDGSNTWAFGDIDGDGYHDVVTFLTGWRFTVEPFEIERIAE